MPLYEEAVQGAGRRLGELHPNTLVFQSHLIRAYEAADRHADAERVSRDMAKAAGQRAPRDEVGYAGSLVSLGSNLLRQRKWAEAEPVIRECLEIRERIMPEVWATANTRSMLGEVLLELEKYDEAEPLLLEGRRGIVAQVEAIPEDFRDIRLRESADRLVRLYEAWDRPEEAEHWRRQLEPDLARMPESPLPKLPADLFATPGRLSGTSP
ncbi:hypothetical protein BH23PLA1_BH23PLA1_41060 [soil metagenome]